MVICWQQYSTENLQDFLQYILDTDFTNYYDYSYVANFEG